MLYIDIDVRVLYKFNNSLSHIAPVCCKVNISAVLWVVLLDGHSSSTQLPSEIGLVV